MWQDADEIIPSLDDYLGQREETITVFNRAVSYATGDIIVFAGERLRVAPQWREDIEKQYQGGWSGVVSFFEHTPGGGAVDRKYLEEIGGNILHPDYIHYFADVELGERARREGKYVEFRHLLTDHLGKTDTISSEFHGFDEQTLNKRTNAGWPNEAVLDPAERASMIETYLRKR